MTRPSDLKIKVYPASVGSKERDIRWLKPDGKTVGYGYLVEEHRIGLIRCPVCERENWAPAVSTGVCCWCNFQAKYHARS